MSQLMADKIQKDASLGAYLSLTWEMVKMNVFSAMEYRVSFIMQIIGMIVNDIGLIALWFIFFEKFPEIRGWTFQDTAALFAVTTVQFSIVMILANGSFRMARMIANGEIDNFLSLPKNVLWQISLCKTEVSAFGDLLFGPVIYFFSGNLSFESFGLFILLSIITAVIFFNFIVITQSIAFFTGNFEEAAVQLFHALLGFTLYPQTAFFGILKIITLTILPAFFIATLPVEIFRNFNIFSLGLMIGFAAITFFIAIFVFKKGLKRYESGNLINIKI